MQLLDNLSFRMFNSFVVRCLVLWSVLQMAVQSPVTVPLKPGGDLDKVIPEYFETKKTKNFHNISPNATKHNAKEIDVSYDFSCNIDMKLRWSTMVGSPVYSTPVAFSTGKNNEKQIYINTYYQYIESLNHDGYKSWGWPLSFEDSSFQTSPLIYDIDGDGNLDIGVVDKNGNLFWIRTGEFGEYLEDYHIQIPKLKVKKDWSNGLDPGFSDKYVRLSMFDKTGSKPNLDAPLPDGSKPIPKAKLDDLKSPKRVLIKPTDKAKSSPKKNSHNNKAPVDEPQPKSDSSHGRRLTESETTEETPSVEDGMKGPSDVNEIQHGHADDTHAEPAQVFTNNNEEATSAVAPESKEVVDTTSEPVAAQEPEESIDAHPLAGLSPEEYPFDADPPVDPFEINHGEMNRDFLHGDDDYAVAMRNHNYGPSADGSHPAERVPPQEQDRLGLSHEPVTRSAEDIATGKDQPETVVEDSPTAAPFEEEDLSGGEGRDPMDHYGYAARTARSADDGNNYYMGHRYGGMVGESTPGNESKYVLVDAHVLTSPVLSDVNGDGHMEIIFAVSYYFDKVEYANKPTHFDPDNYVAGGVVCWDMESQDWTWMVHLDLTTTKSKFQAMIYASPTVVDLDGDGRKEIVIGTSLGLLYLLDGESGFVRRFFPMQFHSIQAQVAVGDVMGGRALEIIVADMGGTVAVVSVDGDILWDVQLTGSLPFTPTLGDVDGDGQMDIVVVAVTEHHGCHIYALRGDTGELLEGYPISLPEHAKVTSSVLLVDLHSSSSVDRFKAAVTSVPTNGAAILDNVAKNITESIKSAFGGQKVSAKRVKGERARKNRGLHLVLTSFDGHVYIIGQADRFNLQNNIGMVERTNCAQRIDVGEHIYSHPLIDDISGDGYLDIVIGTMNGQVLLFETAVPHSPLNAWSSFPKNRLNGFTAGDKGIFVSAEEKERLNLMDIQGGHSLSITFDIFDARYESDLASNPDLSLKYIVSITRGTNRLEPVFTQEYFAPGRYTVVLSVSPPEHTLLVISMQDEHGLYFEDTLFVSLSTKFYVWLKYMVLSPVVVLCVPLLLRFGKYI